MQHVNDGHTAMDDRWVNPINYPQIPQIDFDND